VLTIIEAAGSEDEANDAIEAPDEAVATAKVEEGEVVVLHHTLPSVTGLVEMRAGEANVKSAE
jgi:hypothetical protein